MSRSSLILGFAIFIVLLIIGSKIPFNAPSQPDDMVTMYEYGQVRDGMSYNEVCRIIGAAGTEQSRNVMQGIEGVMPTTVTVMYSWTNPNGSNMNSMFQNDRLVTKAQFGLK